MLTKKGLAGKPLYDWIILRPLKPEEKKLASGIFIPATAKENSMRGIIVAAGPGKQGSPTIVKVGDEVLYDNKHAGEIQIDGDQFVYMREYPGIIMVI